MSRRRTGFTLVEVIVVIAIVAILIALLLVGTQKVRESSSRTQCANNLMQIGMAVKAHVDRFDCYPSAGSNWQDPPRFKSLGVPYTAEKQWASWLYQILPDLGQESLWRGGSATTVQEAQKLIIGGVVPTYFCGSRRSPMSGSKWSMSYTNGGPSGQFPHGMNDYAGANVDGNGVFVALTPKDGSTLNSHGTLTRLSCTRADGIADGASNTLMVSEKSLHPDWHGKDAWGENEGYVAGCDQDTIRSCTLSPVPDKKALDGSSTVNLRFGSSHPMGIMSLFADGSVHTVPFTISLNTFKYLGDVSDGQHVQRSELLD